MMIRLMVAVSLLIGGCPAATIVYGTEDSTWRDLNGHERMVLEVVAEKWADAGRPLPAECSLDAWPTEISYNPQDMLQMCRPYQPGSLGGSTDGCHAYADSGHSMIALDGPFLEAHNLSSTVVLIHESLHRLCACSRSCTVAQDFQHYDTQIWRDIHNAAECALGYTAGNDCN